MKVLGVIAECNPLHTGHEYLLHTLRRETGADFCVVAMSGDYVQRGEPAFFSKELRTKAALSCGADLVMELPLAVSTGSAAYFAQGAVALLTGLGCVTHLGFGSESGDIDAFLSVGKLLCSEPEAYRAALGRNLKNGMNFPKARRDALEQFLRQKDSGKEADFVARKGKPDQPGNHHKALEEDTIAKMLEILESPNNILGAEYVRALMQQDSSMLPVTVKRRGAGYHDGEDYFRDAAVSVYENDPPVTEGGLPAGGLSAPEYASASALRKFFTDFSASQKAETIWEKYIPASCRSLYGNALRNRHYLTLDDFSLPLFYALQYADKETLIACQDVTPELAERILKFRLQAASCTELCRKLHAKNLTDARIRRSLLHILLRVTKLSVSQQKEATYCLYARILGFRREAGPLLSQIKKQASLPLVAKLADARNTLSSLAFSQLQQSVSASQLYRTTLAFVAGKGNTAFPRSEYESGIVVM